MQPGGVPHISSQLSAEKPGTPNASRSTVEGIVDRIRKSQMLDSNVGAANENIRAESKHN